MNDGMQSGHGASGFSANPIVRHYQEVNDRMHAGIALAFRDDADLNFLHAIICHHQGAIDMARVSIIYGCDPEVRELAEAIIIAQSSTIELLETWLKK